MIREFSVKLKPTNNKARTVFIISMSLAFALIMLSTFIPLYKGVVNLVGLSLLVAAVTIYTKYISPIYYYDITFDSEGTPLFVVRQLIGKRQTTLCRIGLAEVVKIEKENATERCSHKTPYGFRKYNYLPTLAPDTTYRLTTMSRYEKSEIVIEASDEFAELLGVYSAKAREYQNSEDEE